MHSSRVLLLAGSAAVATAFAPAPALRAPALSRAAACAGPTMIAEGDAFPAVAAGTLGVKGKNAVVYFYGADGSPSCTKQATAFDGAAAEFKRMGFDVVGVRSAKQAKGEFESKYSSVRFVADQDDAMRKELGIKADLFGALAGRETYVIDKTGTVQMVFNSQFKPEEHVEKALATAASYQGGRQGSLLDSLKAAQEGLTARLGSIGAKK